MADGLTPADYAFLILLKIEGREISNTELDKTHGVRLVGDSYARLNGLGYVESRTDRRPYRHSLTKSGAKVLGSPLAVTDDDAKRSGREQQFWAALCALHADQLDRPGASGSNGHQGLDKRIRAAYAELTTEPGAWVSLTRLRPLFGDVPKPELDRALEQLLDAPDVDLEPEDNRKTLRVEDRRAAVRIGGEDRHLLAIGMR